MGHQGQDRRDFTGTADTTGPDAKGAAAPRESGIQLNPTLWGYVLISDFPDTGSGGFLAGLRRALGALVFLALLGLWISPDQIFNVELLSFKLILTALYLTIGTILLLRRRPRLRREVQVNTRRGELRVGIRDAKGVFQLDGVHGFDDVDVVSLYNPAPDVGADTGADMGVASLLLQLGDSDVAVVAAYGDAQHLAPIRTQLARDLAVFAGGADRVARPVQSTTTPLLLGPRLEGQQQVA